MSIRLILLVCVAALLLCASAAMAFENKEYPVVDTTWGRSVQQAREIQIANPQAGAVRGPVEGFDGVAAEKTMDAYHKSFTEKAAKRGYRLDTVGVVMGGDR